MRDDIRILGPDGQPLRKRDLTEEIAAPSMTGVRQVWQQSVAGGMTPERLAAVLQAAADGNADDYLALAEDMEERDLHYSGVLGQRKRAISGLEIKVHAAGKEQADLEIADEVRALFDTPEVEDQLNDLLDGLGKSYSVIEYRWDTTGPKWKPVDFLHRDARWFQFDRVTGRELRLRDESDLVNGLALAPYRFCVHMPRIKAGLPIRSGLARLAAFAWLCKAYALKDWMAFCEVFGMPLRLGRYGPGASAADIAILRAAVASIGTDAAAILPEGMKIEFIEAAATAGAGELFKLLCEYLDRQISKVVLGQTMSTDAQAAGLGSSQANVHNEVRTDIQRHDAKQLAKTLNRDLVRPYINLNYGLQKVYPRVELFIPEPEDLKLLSDSLAALVPVGLKVKQAEVRSKFGFTDPKPEDELLGVQTAPPPPAGPAAPPAIAVHAERPTAGGDATSGQGARLQREGDETPEGWLASARELLDQVETLEEFRDRLIELHPKMPVGQFTELMAEAMGAAELAGRYDILAQAGLAS